MESYLILKIIFWIRLVTVWSRKMLWRVNSQKPYEFKFFKLYICSFIIGYKINVFLFTE